MSITKQQIQIIQTLLNKRFREREERLEFLSDFFGMEIKSTKELTDRQAFHLIQFLKEGKTIDNAFFARFDAKNAQHRTLLARCHELGWVQSEAPNIVDLNRLGAFLISKKSPVKKALLDMSSKEVSRVIFILEKMIKQKYKNK